MSFSCQPVTFQGGAARSIATVVLIAGGLAAPLLAAPADEPERSGPTGVDIAGAGAAAVEAGVKEGLKEGLKEGVKEGVGELAEQIIEDLQPTLLQLAAKFAGDWFASLVDKPVDKHSPVDHWVLGVRARGSAHTVGRCTMRQLDEESTDERVTFLLTLRGQTISRTRGVRGPVAVRCETTMPFTAYARVWFDGERFVAGPGVYLGDAHLRVASVQTSARIGRRLIERVAWRRIGAQRACAEQIALRTTRQRVLGSFNQSVADHLAGLNERVAKIDLAEKFRQIVAKRSAETSTEMTAEAPLAPSRRR